MSCFLFIHPTSAACAHSGASPPGRWAGRRSWGCSRAGRPCCRGRPRAAAEDAAGSGCAAAAAAAEWGSILVVAAAATPAGEAAKWGEGEQTSCAGRRTKSKNFLQKPIISKKRNKLCARTALILFEPLIREKRFFYNEGSHHFFKPLLLFLTCCCCLCCCCCPPTGTTSCTTSVAEQSTMSPAPDAADETEGGLGLLWASWYPSSLCSSSQAWCSRCSWRWDSRRAISLAK